MYTQIFSKLYFSQAPANVFCRFHLNLIRRFKSIFPKNVLHYFLSFFYLISSLYSTQFLFEKWAEFWIKGSGRNCLLSTEKNAIFRKILILLINISKIIICFSELRFDASSNIDFFVSNWDFRCFYRYCVASEQLNLLKTKYFSERSFFVSWHSPFASTDKVEASFGSAGGWGGFTGTRWNEWVFLLYYLNVSLYFYLLKVNFINHNKCTDYYQIYVYAYT